MPEILPDCRAREPKDVKRIVWNGLQNWVPIYCANCGASGGRVPEESTNFAFYLCNACVESWGAIAGTYMEPDEVFWARIREPRTITEKLLGED